MNKKISRNKKNVICEEKAEYGGGEIVIYRCPSVGYRVNSKRGTQFRIWASNVLRDHILRGYSNPNNCKSHR